LALVELYCFGIASQTLFSRANAAAAAEAQRWTSMTPTVIQSSTSYHDGEFCFFGANFVFLARILFYWCEQVITLLILVNHATELLQVMIVSLSKTHVSHYSSPLQPSCGKLLCVVSLVKKIGEAKQLMVGQSISPKVPASLGRFHSMVN
jgi:hypothetical protein